MSILNPSNQSLLKSISIRNKEHLDKINSVSKDLLLYGRFVKEKHQVKSSRVMNSSYSNSNLLFNRSNNMSQNIKDKLSSFYNDVMTPMSSTNRSSNNNKVMLIPNRNRDVNVNYEEIKKKEQINKTKNEIFDILKKSMPSTKKSITKSYSCVNLFKGNLCDGFRNEVDKMFDKPKLSSGINKSNVECTSYRKEIELGYDYLSKMNNKRFKYVDDDFYTHSSLKRKNESMQKLKMILQLSSI